MHAKPSKGNDNPSDTPNGNLVVQWLGVIGLVYLIILAVGVIGAGFKWVSGGADGAKDLFEFATNPIMGLIVGTLATALVQSSSTVTSVIVGLVAGGLAPSVAIPMIMGANIGTTITNSLVSLGHVRKKSEFRRAFAAATVHDFFNWLAVAIFLPLEIAFGILEKISLFLSEHLFGGDSLAIGGLNFIKPITKPVISLFKDGFAVLPEPLGAVAMILFGIGIIFVAIMFIGRLLKKLMVGRAKQILHAAIGRGPVAGIASGTAVTVLVQSSSTTTSLAVPLAGSGVFGLREIYPFTLGANIGTTVTALLAATGVSGEFAVFALEVALVHLMFNVFGVIVIFGIPFLREIPLKCAEWMAGVATEKRPLALAYIVTAFFVLPGLFVGFTAMF